MDLKEMQEHRKNMEMTLTNAIRGFEAATGLSVTGVDLKVAPRVGMYTLKFVTADVALPHRVD